MAHISPFQPATALPRRPHRAKRSLDSKTHEISLRSPKDAAALHTVCDMVLARLNEEDLRRHQK